MAAKKPSTPKQISAARAKGVRKGQATRQTNKAVARRQEWEKSPEGQARMTSLADLHPGHSLHHLYEHYGFHQEQGGPTVHDRQLPGLEDTYAAPQQKRWEDHTPKQQESIQRRVAQKTGADLDFMTRSFGAQLDQSYLRAHRHGVEVPHAMDFYGSGEPAQVLRKTAEHHNVPLGVVAALHADNSPSTPFHIAGRYPQDEMARAALTHAQTGGDPEKIVRPPKSMGTDTNLRKSARRAHQMLNEGRTLAETSPSTSGHGLGAKTGPYHNAWLPSTPDFFVSDVHSGGGGGLPHLSTEKPVKMRNGKPVRKTKFRGDPRSDEELGTKSMERDKAERERGIETSGFHAMMDFAARSAMSQRGLSHVRQAQAAQWGEERIQRGLKHEEHAYPPPMPPPVPHPDQLPLFNDRRS